MWMVESSAEDLYVLDNYAPMKFQPGKTRNDGVAMYLHASFSFEIIELDNNCTNQKREKNIVICLYNTPRSINNTSWSTSMFILAVL